MNISWNYDSEIDQASIITDTKLVLTLDFFNYECTLVSGCDFDIYPDTELSRNFFVKIGGEYITVKDLILKAESEYDDMKEEAEEESEIESQYRADVSSLEFTGRV